MSVLIFGYEPFLEFDENPSMIVAERLKGKKIAGSEIKTRILPVEYSKVEDAIVEAINEFNPSLVIGLGLAAGRNKVTPEKIAVNYKRSSAADNAGVKVNGEKIDRTQPDGIFSTLPVEAITDALNKKGIPSSLSLSAGGYLCNFAMFVIVRESIKRGFKGGFIHVPCHEELVSKNPSKNLPSMNIDKIQSAVELSIETSLNSGL